jgi:prophage DNA circulation protein
MTVSLLSYSVTESTDEGRVARFALQFVETGQLEFPSPLILPEIDLTSAVAAAQSFAGLDLSIDLDGPAWLVADAVAAVTGTIAAARELVFGPAFAAIDAVATIGAAFDDLALEIETLIRTPADLSAAWDAALATWGDWMALIALDPSAPPAYGGDSPAEQAANTNAAAIVTQVRRSALAAAVGALPGATFATATDATEALDLLTAALDTDDALADLRIAAATYLRQVALNLPALRTYTPPEVTPTLAIAYELYGNVDRAPEIEARNDIAHPLFASGALEVLGE